MVINSQWSLGAQIVGVNCHFDPMTCVKAVKMMKEGVEKAGLKAHYMVQPLAFHTPDCNCQGFIDLPEFPFGNIFFACTLKERKKKTFVHAAFHFSSFSFCSQPWNPGFWPDGICTSTQERPTRLASDSLEAAVGLSRTTSGLWQRSWPLREE